MKSEYNTEQGDEQFEKQKILEALSRHQISLTSRPNLNTNVKNDGSTDSIFNNMTMHDNNHSSSYQNISKD